MSLISFSFFALVLFTLIAYFLVPKKWQWLVVMAANIVFYAFAGIKYFVYILATSLVTWYVAIRLERLSVLSKQILPSLDDPAQKKATRQEIASIRKMLCCVAVLVALGIWVVLKYTNFFIGIVNSAIHLIGKQRTFAARTWIVPLGISFYTMYAVGYLIDVYRSRYPAEKNFFKYFTFISFFPHMIQGPFDRFNQLGKSLFEPHAFSWDRLCEGCARILWGVFKKMIVADKLSIAVNTIFDHYTDYSGVSILFAILAYGFQLYADFSGYMDIVSGVSHIMGVEMPLNFRQPYFSRSIDEFWRRWHITLGAWFKDYVFYPVSMSKLGQNLGKWARKKWGARTGKLFPGYLALFCVWTATGLWHGANWTFLVWGYLNFIFILVSTHLEEKNNQLKAALHINSEGWAWKLFSIARTFFLVCFFRFFTVSPTVGEAANMLGHTVSAFIPAGAFGLEQLFVGMKKLDILVCCSGTLMLIVSDILNETGAIDRLKQKCPMLLRNLFYAALIIALLLFAGGENDLVGGFMYANF